MLAALGGYHHLKIKNDYKLGKVALGYDKNAYYQLEKSMSVVFIENSAGLNLITFSTCPGDVIVIMNVK